MYSGLPGAMPPVLAQAASSVTAESTHADETSRFIGVSSDAGRRATVAGALVAVNRVSRPTGHAHAPHRVRVGLAGLAR
jgi:hypothetical protein